MIEVMTKIGAAKIAACVTDSPSNMVSARKKAEAHPALSHVIYLPCFMHQFSLLIGSILGHAHAKDTVAQASKLVNYFRASQRPLEALHTIARGTNIRSTLQRPNATRFTSVYTLLNSVKQLEQPLKTLVETDANRPEAEKLLPKTATGMVMQPLFSWLIPLTCLGAC